MAANFVPYEPLIDSVFYPHLSLLLSLTGLFFMSWFFTLQVTKNKSPTSNYPSDTKLMKEVVIALLGSFFLGFGILFVCLNVGIYV